MSLILLGLSTLDANEDKVPICNLPIRTATCGGNFSCHFTPDVDQILKGFGLDANEEVKDSFAMPQKWFCSEFTLFSLWHFKEKSKSDAETGLENFFVRQQDTSIHKNKTNKLTYNFDLETLEKEISNKNSVGEMFDYLESHQFRCYYSSSKRFFEEGIEEPTGVEMIICYQENNGSLEPNESFKVIFDIVYHLDGRVEIVDWMISEDEERTFKKIVEFDN